MAEAILDTSKINDWHSFHAQSAEVFGFPAFYGSNINAWIDCLSYLPEGDGMSRYQLSQSEQLFIHLQHFSYFTKAQPEIYQALTEAVASINRRYISDGDIPRLVLVPQ